MELDWGTEDEEYLHKVERNMEKALQEHSPDVVIYNAGTDVLEGDRLGGLAISPEVGPDAGGGHGLWGILQQQESWEPVGGSHSRPEKG